MCPPDASIGKKSNAGDVHPTTSPNTSSYDQGVLIKLRLPSFAVSPGNTDIRSARLIVDFSAGFCLRGMPKCGVLGVFLQIFYVFVLLLLSHANEQNIPRSITPEHVQSKCGCEFRC